MRGDGNRELLPTPGLSEADQDGGGGLLLPQAVLQAGEPPLGEAGGDDVQLGPGLVSPLNWKPELGGLVDAGVGVVEDVPGTLPPSLLLRIFILILLPCPFPSSSSTS